MRPRARRLSLGRETLRRLDGGALARAAAAAIEPPGNPTWPPTVPASSACPTSRCFFTVLCTVTCDANCGRGG